MRGRPVKKSPQSKDAKSGLRLELLMSQITELEKRVAQLESEVFESNRLRIPEAPKPKPGPKPKLSEDELLKRRDALIYWLEDNWPEFRIAIRKARKAEHLIPVLRAATPLGSHRNQAPFYSDWKKYWPQLWEFIESGRYHNNPRNIANAMAGIPELSWKRSFDICTGQASQLEIQKRAVLDYLQRKVRYRLRAIREAKGDVALIRDILNRRSKDRQLRILAHQAEHIDQYLADGQPK